MAKRVLDVGQCEPDHSAIRSMLNRHFDVEIVRAHQLDDTLDALRSKSFDLVLVNRKLDADYTDGIAIIDRIKSDPQLAQITCMLVSNYSEHQEQAIAVGAVLGFGKAELAESSMHKRLEPYLGNVAVD